MTDTRKDAAGLRCRVAEGPFLYALNSDDGGLALIGSNVHTPEAVRGVRDAVPVALGYVPAALAYGLLAKAAGIPASATVGMSLLVYAGASQFAAVNMLAASQSPLSIIAVTFILNLRHFLMSTALASRLPERSRLKRAAVAFGVTDETFSVASFGGRPLSVAYLLGLNTTAYLAWAAGTVLGFLAGGILPAFLQAGMGVALYALFVGLLVPGLQRSRAGLAVALSAMGLNVLAQALLPPGPALVIAAVLAAAAAAWVEPNKADRPAAAKPQTEESP